MGAIIKRLIFVGPGALIMIVSANHPMMKYKLIGLAVGGVLAGIGHLIWSKFLTKKDKEFIKDQQRTVVNVADKLSNPKENILNPLEKKLAQGAKKFLQKADENTSPAEKIRELNSLKEDGIISEEEFSEAKEKLLKSA
jgi:hypothetical protein